MFHLKILAALFPENEIDYQLFEKALELLKDPGIEKMFNQMAADLSLPRSTEIIQSHFQKEIAEKNINTISQFLSDHQIYDEDFLLELIKVTLEKLEIKKHVEESIESDSQKARENMAKEFAALKIPVPDHPFGFKREKLDFSNEFLKDLSRQGDFLNFFKKYLNTELNDSAKAIVHKILSSMSARDHLYNHLQIMEWIISDKRNEFNDLILYANYVTNDREHIIQMHSEEVIAMFTALLQGQKAKFSEVFDSYFQMQKVVGDHHSTVILRTLIEVNAAIPLKELASIFSIYFEAKEAKRTAQDSKTLTDLLGNYFHLYRHAFKRPVKNPTELQQRFIDFDFVSDFAFYLEEKAKFSKKEIIKGFGFDIQKQSSSYWMYGEPSLYLEGVIEKSQLTESKKKKFRKILNLYLENFQKYLMSFRLLNLLKLKKEFAAVYAQGLTHLKTDLGTAAYSIKLDYSYLFECFYDFIHYVPYLEKEGRLKSHERQVFKILETSFKHKEFNTVEELVDHFENLIKILRNMIYAIDGVYVQEALNLLEHLIDSGKSYDWALVESLIKPEWRPSAGKKMMLPQNLLDKLNEKMK